MKLPTKLILTTIALFVVAFFFASCDERNEADLAPEIYKLVSTIDTEGGALYVHSNGNYLGVSASAAGTFLYDVSNPANPSLVFEDHQTGILFSRQCVVDAANHLMLVVNGPSGEAGDRYSLHDYVLNRRIGSANISGTPVAVQLRSEVDSLAIWVSDANDGFLSSLWCRSSDTTWAPNCPDFGFALPYLDPTRFRGFDMKGIYAAVATSVYRVNIYDVALGPQVPLSSLGTPGDPQDCAWFGNYVVVADYYYVTVLDATTPEDASVVASIVIPGADRLRRVVIDGNTAVLLDDSDGIYVVDISDPLRPSHKQFIPLPEPAEVSVNNGKLFVADQQLGVLIYTR